MILFPRTLQSNLTWATKCLVEYCLVVPSHFAEQRRLQVQWNSLQLKVLKGVD